MTELELGKERSFLKKLLLCLLSGILLGLSQPLYINGIMPEPGPMQAYLGLLVFVGFVPFFLVIHQEVLKKVFWWSLLTISIYFVVVLFWIYIALRVHGYVHPLPAGLITYLLALKLALVYSLFITLGRFLSVRFSWSFLFIIPMCICSAAYFLNFLLFGGFPWGNVGYSIGRIDQFLQLGSLVGVYGLVFLVVLINSFITSIILTKYNNKKIVFSSCVLIIIMSWFGFGHIRLSSKQDTWAPSIRVGLLQGNIAQSRKHKSRHYAQDIIKNYKKLALEVSKHNPELIIWPETAYPRVIEEERQNFTPPGGEGIAAVMGAPAYGFGSGAHEGSHYHNSAFVIDYQGVVKRRYDKSHLVPFGEYVPWPLKGVVDKIVPGLGAWRPGTSFRAINLALNAENSIRVGLTICYEGIFPEISRAYAKNGVSLLVNITNDAWYERSSAPFQHFLMYRMRSVETGLPFVRATNSGISGWIDSYGGIHKPTKLFEKDYVVDDIYLSTHKTLYVLLGDFIALFCLIFLAISYMFAVVPIKQIIKNKKWKHIGLLVLLLVISVGSHVYFGQEKFNHEESAGTKIFVIDIFCILVLVGALKKSKRSAKILNICATSIIFMCFGLAWVESVYFLLGLIPGLLIYYLGFRMRDVLSD